MLEKIIEGTRTYFKESGKSKAVIGLSGGIDSSLCCHIAAKALGPENVFAYHLPYFDSEDLKDAEAVAKLAGARFENVSIKKIVDAAASAAGVTDLKQKGNIMARERMVLLYAFAAKHDALVIGTSNKTEIALGYFTKHGDDSADVLPLGSLYKTDVRKLAKQADLPAAVLKKTPTAGLWSGQTDEGEIGMAYDEMDAILRALEAGKRPPATKEHVDRILFLMRSTEHKRRPAPIIPT